MNITISAYSLEARRLMFDKWCLLEDRELFIDGRLTAEHFEVYAVQKGQEQLYKDIWFPSSEAAVLSCSFKSTTHNAMGIAWCIQGVLNNYLSDSDLREVPFSTKMNIAMFDFNVEYKAI